MSRWLDTVFARLLMLQFVVGLMFMVLVALWGTREQGEDLARITASLWLPALQADPPLNQTTTQRVTATVNLVPGPPPALAREQPFMWRFPALARDLNAGGLPVRTIKVSGFAADAVTWLEIEEGDSTRWVGVRGNFGSLNQGLKALTGTLMAVGFSFIAAWWLSRRILRPLAALREDMRRFDADGSLPQLAARSAPAELRELAQQFATLARQRGEIDHQRRTMLAGISHDLRSPLGRIRVAAALLPDGPDIELRREIIVRNVHLADRLLGSFIDMARADGEPLTATVDLTALVRDVALSVPDVRVIALPDDEVLIAPANAAALERALRNLIDNARQHGAAPIEIALYAESLQTVLTVRDHGPGIPLAQRELMLQPFFRGEVSRHNPGTGLGLAIVKRTTARHGGRTELSDAQPGLRVALHLPAGTP